MSQVLLCCSPLVVPVVGGGGEVGYEIFSPFFPLTFFSLYFLSTVSNFYLLLLFSLTFEPDLILDI